MLRITLSSKIEQLCKVLFPFLLKAMSISNMSNTLVRLKTSLNLLLSARVEHLTQGLLVCNLLYWQYLFKLQQKEAVLLFWFIWWYHNSLHLNGEELSLLSLKHLHHFHLQSNKTLPMQLRSNKPSEEELNAHYLKNSHQTFFD